MRTSATLLALAALNLGQSWAGAAHAHLHHEAHANPHLRARELAGADWYNIDWNKLGIDWSKVDYSNKNGGANPTTTTTTTTAAPTATTASANQPSSTTTSGTKPAASSVNAGEFTGLFDNLWRGLKGCSNDRTAFGDRTASSGEYINYKANTGSPYGSNMMLVDAIGDHTYTVTVKNTSPEEMTINVWNKNGKDGQLNNGATDAPKFTTLTFNLSPGQSAIFACDENSVLSFCEAVDRFDASGAFATTWAEIKLKNKDSGYNVSKILNKGKEYKIKMYARPEETDCVSSDTQNHWITETDTVGSGSCYIPHYGAHLTVEMGGV